MTKTMTVEQLARSQGFWAITEGLSGWAPNAILPGEWVDTFTTPRGGAELLANLRARVMSTRGLVLAAA